MYIRGIEAVWVQKMIQEKSEVFRRVLNYLKFSCILFYTKMSRYSDYTYCIQGKSTNIDPRLSIPKCSDIPVITYKKSDITYKKN